MANTARLNVEILVDAAKAAAGLNQTASKFESFASTATKVFAGAFAFSKIMDGAKVAVAAASDLEQAMGGVDAVFKASAGQIHAWASDSTDSIRVTQAEWERLATVIGAQLKNAGVSMGQLAPQTRQLMQLGADLAAQFGTSVPQAIEAISSALKGERDPIERYGVTLKQAAINAKALEIAQGDQALAASQAVQAQATLALIYQQSADAQGAAARESETFAARVDNLKEKLGNMAAAIGGPLLDGVGSLADRLGDLAPALEPIGIALATFVSAIAQLPTPVIAAGTALLLLTTVGPRVVAALAGIGAGLSGMMTTLGRVSAIMLTTPWGLALTAGLLAAGAAFAVFTAGAKAAADQAAITKTATDSLFRALQTGGNLRVAALDPFQAKLREVGSSFENVGKASAEAGVDVDTFMRGLVGDGGAADQVLAGLRAKVDDLRKAYAETTVVTSEGGLVGDDSLLEQADAIQQLIDVYSASVPAAGDARKALDDYNKATGEGAEGADEAADATKKLADALKAAQEAADRTAGNLLLESVKREADDAARAMDIFNAAMADTLGRSTDYESTTLAWADGIRAVAEAARDANGAIDPQALAEWDIGALASTEAGSKLAATLIQTGENFGKFVTQAFEASGGASNLNVALGAAHTAADQAYGDFLTLADGLGLTTEQAQQLAGKLGIVNAQQLDDKVFEIIAQDENARAAVAALQASGVDPKTIKFVADTDPLTDGLQAGLTYVDSVTGETKTITIGATTDPATAAAAGAAATIDGTTASLTVTGNTAPAASAVAGVAAAAAGTTASVNVQANTTAAQGAITALTTQSRTLTITVAANTAPATATISALTGAAYKATVVVTANTAPAAGLIATLTGSTYRATVEVGANTGPASSAIAGVTGSRYSATVVVSADTSPFWAAFNALPTTRTVTVNTVSAPAPAGLAPAVAGLASLAPEAGMMRSLAAPADTGPVRASGSSSAGVVINVNGALDPDAVARQIRRILVGRDRRMGGVEIGAMRARVGGGV